MGSLLHITSILLLASTLALGDHRLPIAKDTIQQMDYIISNHIAWNDWDAWSKAMEPFWTEDFVYDTNYCPIPSIMNVAVGLRAWYDHEHIPFCVSFGNYTTSQMIFVADDISASTTTYMRMHWREDFAAIPKPKAEGDDGILMRVYDFYKMDGDRIAYNWMRLDLVLLMHQSLGDGTRVVPKPDLPEFFRPPNVLEGHPVPDEMFVKDEDSAKAKELVQQLLERDFMYWEMAAKDDKHLTSPYFHFYGSEGYGAAMTPDLYQQHIVSKIKSAFSPDSYEFAVFVLVCEGKYCAVTGEFRGIHGGDFLGENATGKNMTLPYGMHFRVAKVAEGDTYHIEEGWGIFEIPEAMQTIGVDLWQRLAPQPRK